MVSITLEKKDLDLSVEHWKSLRGFKDHIKIDKIAPAEPIVSIKLNFENNRVSFKSKLPSFIFNTKLILLKILFFEILSDCIEIWKERGNLLNIARAQMNLGQFQVIIGHINDKVLIEVEDDDSPFLKGGAGLVVDNGTLVTEQIILN